MFQFSQTSLNRMMGVDPRLIGIAKRALEISKIDFGIPAHGGLRTAQEQKELFLQGVSKADGFEKPSYHQTGKALDVYAYVDGKASWHEEHLTHIAAAMLQAASQLGYRLEWGGFWKNFVDMPHFQIK